LAAAATTVTVEAAFSKHRRRDVIPRHPELVTMLTQWLKDYEPAKVLSPKLAKRRFWFMVKRDLERVGIEYETPEGIADFHAAGRHTHITELPRDGASLPEAKQLARHSDTKMTMRYTHIGIADQAKALKQLSRGRPQEHRTPASSTVTTPATDPGSEQCFRAAGIAHEKHSPLFRTIDRRGLITGRGMTRNDALRMVKRRVLAAGLSAKVSCHSFRAAGITAYLENGGTIENAQAIAAHESPRTTKLYDRTRDEVTLDEIERIVI
jgi:integrase